MKKHELFIAHTHTLHYSANSEILNKLFFLNVTFLCCTNIILKF